MWFGGNALDAFASGDLDLDRDRERDRDRAHTRAAALRWAGIPDGPSGNGAGNGKLTGLRCGDAGEGISSSFVMATRGDMGDDGDDGGDGFSDPSDGSGADVGARSSCNAGTAWEPEVA